MPELDGEQQTSSGFRWFQIGLAILIPLALAFGVQLFLESEREEEKDSYQLAADARALLDNRPKPEGPREDLQLGLKVGERWEISLQFRPANEPAEMSTVTSDPVDFRAEDHDAIFDLEVLSRDDDARRSRVRIRRRSSAAEPDAPATDTREFFWHDEGHTSWPLEASDQFDFPPADEFRLRWALVLPPPFPASAQRHEFLHDSVTIDGPFGRSIAKRLEVKTGSASFPPQGGWYAGNSRNAANTGLTWIQYSRNASSGDHWAGARETLVHAEFSAQSDRLAFLSGTWRLRERFDLARGDATTAIADRSLEVTQEARLR